MERFGLVLQSFTSSAEFSNERVPKVCMHAWLFEDVEPKVVATTSNRFFHTLPEMAWRMLVRFDTVEDDSDNE